MRVDRKLVRGYPQVDGYVMVDGAYLAKVVGKDYDYISFSFLVDTNIKSQDIKVVNPVTKEEILQLEKEKPHLFV